MSIGSSSNIQILILYVESGSIDFSGTINLQKSFDNDSGREFVSLLNITEVL